MLDAYRRATIALCRSDADLSQRQMAVLLQLVTTGEPQTIRGLAALLDAPPASMTRAVDALTERGFARRQPAPADRRSVLVVPTADGLRFVAKLRAWLEAGAVREAA